MGNRNRMGTDPTDPNALSISDVERAKVSFVEIFGSKAGTMVTQYYSNLMLEKRMEKIFRESISNEIPLLILNIEQKIEERLTGRFDQIVATSLSKIIEMLTPMQSQVAKMTQSHDKSSGPISDSISQTISEIEVSPKNSQDTTLNLSNPIETLESSAISTEIEKEDCLDVPCESNVNSSVDQTHDDIVGDHHNMQLLLPSNTNDFEAQPLEILSLAQT
jgi:hypothetical protein